ncbi:CMP-N-acetylneuraminic acid synthetase [Syntrophus gentianae]|uniref:CMP-N-acetylneuraminic acid synthetase n=1 Tax=Syntrophus gentianae TaxID=43775 RepID=A0A1H7X7B4_9BACT|nr:acylneuraminate cytidylyltransferase family protein [Syntrophus gentianae]SEM29710.1 CMP-N-acetylneuraminic acid synthetase [Syntrophus gentianae]
MPDISTPPSPAIVALVPMRHHSERVPGKNYRLFAGRPLYHCIVESLLACPFITGVIIDTDSRFIMDDAQRHFPHVRLIERPEHLRDGKISTNDILMHDVSQTEADFFLQTHSTNPLLRSETISRAVKYFFAHYPDCDSLFSATRHQTRLWDHQGKPINHNPAILLRTQDLPPIFEENSNIYLFSRKTLEQHHNRIGAKPLMFEIDPAEAWDIDNELDFQISEFLYLHRHKTLTP